MKTNLTKKQVKNWLVNYEKAWKNGDTKILSSLFTDDALYYENPFQKPLKGLKEIENYWRSEDKVWSNVKFKIKNFCIIGDKFFAEWICELVRISTKTKTKMAGMFICETQQNRVKIFKEYWHINN